MLVYRRIEEEKELARIIYDSEMRAPRWFRDAFCVWVKSFDGFLEFWDNCNEIYGLFDGDKFISAVYLDFKADNRFEIHISVVAKCPNSELVRYFASLRRFKLKAGFTIQTGWLVSRNRQMLEVARLAGFHQTGLKMSYGHTKDTVFTWLQVAGDYT